MDRHRDLRFELAVSDALEALTNALFSAPTSLPDMARAVLAQARSITGSEEGRVSVIDPRTGDDVALARTAWGGAAAPAQADTGTRGRSDAIAPEDRLRRTAGGRYPGLWGHALETRQPFHTGAPAAHPGAAEGPAASVPLRSFLAAPAVVCERLLGQVVLANAPDGFHDGHLSAVVRLTRLFAQMLDHRRVVEELGESEQRHREAQRIARIGHWSLDLATDRLTWSAEVYRIFGLDPARFGASYEAFLNAIHPADRALVNNAYSDSLASRQPYDITHRLLLDGDRVAYVHERCETFYDAEGHALRSVGTVQDVTELVEAEQARKKIEQRLRQSQKMEAIGTLAGGIAHDFNNMLTPIIGFGQMVLEGLPEGSDARRQQEEVVKAALRASELVKQILTFSRQSDEERRPLLLQPVVKEALRLLRATLPATVEMRVDVQPECGLVLADPTHIHQVVLNLCTNAWHAMRETGGVLGVELREVDVTPADDITRVGHPPGTYVRLTVSDTGHGMTPEVREKIFEPYFTTKPQGEGTGLGLSIVHGIVRAHGGYISVYSEPGKGTTFHVTLPCAGPGVAPLEARPAAETRCGGGHVLVVDDESPIADMLREMLGGMGFEVTATTSSPEALALVRADPAAFDLVITDMTMPRLTGLELSREILRLRSDLPIVLCTGFSELVTDETAREAGIRGFMMKPVLRSDLCALLSRLRAAAEPPAADRGGAPPAPHRSR